MKKKTLFYIFLTGFFLNSIFPFPVKAAVNVGISPSGHFFNYNNKTLFLLGDGGTQVVPMNGNLDYQAWIDSVSSLKISTILIWPFIGPDPGDTRLGDFSGKSALLPWPVSAGKYNLQSWNETYWTRLSNIISYAKSKGMVVVVTPFFGWAKTGGANPNWNYHPFHTTNGGYTGNNCDVLKLDSPGTEIHTQTFSASWPPVKKIQWHWEKYALRLIELANNHGNVIFDYRDEWSYCDTEAENSMSHWRNFFRNRNQIWADKSSTADFRVANPAVPAFGSSPSMKTEGPPYGHEEVRAEVWNRAIAGIHYILHNDARTPNIACFDPDYGTNCISDKGREYVGHTSKFFNTIVKNLDSLTPQNSLVSTGAKSLSSAGNEYVVWIQGGGNFTVNLASGSYTVLWYNPVNGTQQAAADVSGGAVKSFTPPFSNDAVLHLVKKGTTTVTPIISPSNPPPTSPAPSGSPPAGGKPGDANNDNNVDGLDYVIWLNHYNQSATGAGNGDFDESGKVDGLDYVIWLSNYGK